MSNCMPYVFYKRLCRAKHGNSAYHNAKRIEEGYLSISILCEREDSWNSLLSRMNHPTHSYTWSITPNIMILIIDV